MTSTYAADFGTIVLLTQALIALADLPDAQTLRPCSFTIVIQQLPVELQDPVCVFYLVLRALDTVEDDMAIDSGEKLPILHSFHQKIYDRQVTLLQLQHVVQVIIMLLPVCMIKMH